MKSPETISSTISNILSILTSQKQWLVVKVFTSYNIVQSLCDFVHVLMFVNVSKCQKNPKLTNTVLRTDICSLLSSRMETIQLRSITSI